MSTDDLKSIPQFDYVLDTLPNQSLENQKLLYETFLRPGENVYFGPVPKSALKFDRDQDITSIMSKFFVKKLYKRKEYNVRDTSHENVEFKDFLKLCWLTQQYFTVGFKSYFGAHYNPRTQQNVIHPGGGRNIVYKLFDNNDYITMFYFNTLEQQWPWLSDMYPLSFDKLTEMGYGVQFVADHSSLIPHIFWVKDETIPTTSEGVGKYQIWFKKRLSQLKIYSNCELPEYLSCFVVKHVNESNQIIEFKNYSEISLFKALLIAINRIDYCCNDFTVVYNKLILETESN